MKEGNLTEDKAEFLTHHFGTTVIADNNNENNPSVIARVINGFVNKFNEEKRLPKWVIILLEDDIIEAIPYKQFGITETYGHVIDYMMSCMKKMVQKIRDELPLKASKFLYPHFVWVEPTLHTNQQNITLRTKFIRSLHVVAQMHNNVIALPLRYPWNPNYTQLFTWLGQKTTPEGHSTMWSALDSIMKFADTKLMRNHGLYLHNIFQKNKEMEDANKRTASWDEKIKQRRQKRKLLKQQMDANPRINDTKRSSSTLGNQTAANQTTHNGTQRDYCKRRGDNNLDHIKKRLFQS